MSVLHDSDLLPHNSNPYESALLQNQNSEPKIKIFIVNPSLGSHQVENQILNKFVTQFEIDRRQQMKDYDTVLQLPVERTVHQIHRSGKHLWFIKIEDEYIGYLTFTCGTPGIANSIAIGDFFIDQPFRGKGYGKKAFSIIINYFYTLYPESERLSLAVLKDNITAKTLYQKFGFTTKIEMMILENPNIIKTEVSSHD